MKTRETRRERKNAKFAQKAREEIQLCSIVGEFHKAYLEIELGCEEAYLERIQARLKELEAQVAYDTTEVAYDTTEVEEDGIVNCARRSGNRGYRKQTLEF